MPGARESSLFIMALCLAAAPVYAQTAPVVTSDDFLSIAEVAAGVYLAAPADVNRRPACQDLAIPCASGRTVPDGGVFVSAAVYPADMIGIVGEASLYANNWLSYRTTSPVGGRAQLTCPVDQTNHVLAALAGLRVRTPLIKTRSSRGRWFAQALVGPQWSDIGPRQRVLQPGVGYDGYLRGGFAVRVEIDYRLAPKDVRDLSTHRILVAIAIPLGSR
jgi:hypothetical protein